METDKSIEILKETISQKQTGITLFQKIWQKHLVKTIPEGPDVIYIDKHFIHEVYCSYRGSQCPHC